uniref:Uncharacterized protein n=1 Tax=Seriola lalandi dorsalis TaxID=1841481 RepID=A0A3B4WEB2_SERLL
DAFVRAVSPRADSLFDLNARDLLSTELVPLSKHAGCVCLTPRNYRELVLLHDELYARGLRILAFPCDQFGRQER